MSKKQFKAKEPVKVRYKKLKDGNYSIYLDYWNGETQKREYMFLNKKDLYLYPNSHPEAKEHNEYVLRVANDIKNDKLKALLQGKAGIKEHKKSKVLILDYINLNAVDKGKSVKMQLHTLGKLLDAYDSKLTLGEISKDTILKFSKFLQGSIGKRGKLAPTTIQKYLSVFYGLLLQAYDEKLISENPVKQLRKKEKFKAKPVQRCYLEREELQRLIDTDCRADIKQAFLFACFCGLRISDIKNLKWSNIKESENGVSISIIQHKTKEPLVIPLSKSAIKYLPTKPEKATKENFVFQLPTIPVLSKIIKDWSERANIDKYVTFHTSRHTYATLLLTQGGDLYTTAKLLGHKKIETTQIYAEIVDEKKQKTVALLDNLF